MRVNHCLMRMHWYIRVFSAIVLLSLVGCKKNNNPISGPNDNTVIVAPEVRVLSPTATAALKPLVGSQDTLVFNGTQTDIAVNQIIASNLGEGILRRVKSIQTTGGQTIVLTTQASIVEALPTATFADSIQITQSTVEVSGLGKGIQFDRTAKVNELKFTFTKAVLYDRDGNDRTAGDQLIATGSLTLEFRPKLEFKTSGGKLQRLLFSIEPTATIELSFEVPLEFPHLEKEFRIATVKTSPVTFFVGAVPVVITNELPIMLGFDGSVKASLKTGIKNKTSFLLGGLYENGSWSGLSRFNNQFTFDSPQLTGEVSLQVYVAPKLQTKLYAVAGPSVKMKGYVEGIGIVNLGLLTGQTTMNAELYGGFQGSVGMLVEVLDFKLASWESPTLFDARVKLYEWSSTPNLKPAIPSAPNPADNAAGISSSASLAWNCTDPEGDPLLYDVYFGTTASPATVATGRTSTTFNPGVLSSSTRYYWKIRANDNNKNFSDSPVWSFTTGSAPNNPPAVPSNPSPSNGATNQTTSPILSWTCSDPDGDPVTYDIFFGTTNPPMTQVATGQSATTLSRSGLSNSTTYYWKVNAKDSKGATTTGTVWSLTTASAALPTVTTTSITGVSTNSATGGGNVTTQGSSSVTSRGVCWSTSQNPTTADSKTADGSGTGAFTSSITGLSPATPYNVRAYATNSAGTSYGSQVSFTTAAAGAAPQAPGLLSPLNGTTGISLAPTLSWNASTGATSYTLQVSTGSSFTSYAYNQPVSGTSQQVTGLSNSTPYFWRVYASNTYGTSGPSATWNFTTSSSGSVVVPGMVAVAGGIFTAGSTPVSISSFRIDKYEVTYELWTDIRSWGMTHGYTDLPAGRNGYNPVGTNNPVTEVSWYAIVKWCNARSEKDGLTPVYYTDGTQNAVYRTGETAINSDAVKWNANGYRLPTEAEWEFAARGGTQTHSYTYSGSNTVGDVAWHISNSGNSTHTVGQKTANELGLYDMSGNVWEWCWDWYGSAYPSGGTADPKGPSTAQSGRLLRGGSFDLYEWDCRVDERTYSSPAPSYRAFNLGFRCVQD